MQIFRYLSGIIGIPLFGWVLSQYQMEFPDLFLYVLLICCLIMICYSVAELWPFIRENYTTFDFVYFMVPILTLMTFVGLQANKIRLYNKYHPRLEITLSLYPPERQNLCKSPLKEYTLLIDNKNNDSAPIYDFRMEIIFKNPIFTIQSKPLVRSGDWLSVAILNNTKAETVFGKRFSILNEANSVKLEVEKWPERVGFTADICENVPQKNSILIKTDKSGTYNLMYFYEIKGTKFCDKVENQKFINVFSNQLIINPCL